MKLNLKNRQMDFTFEESCLVRIVTAEASDGRHYTQRCSKEAFEAVAWAMENWPRHGTGATVRQIARQEHMPFTQVDVALAFLDERGILDTRHRRRYPVATSVHLDAMCEFHALDEESRLA